MTQPVPNSGGDVGGGGRVQPASVGENTWTRRYGPLPLWAWFAIGGGALLVLWYRNKSQSNAQDQTAADSTSASQIPQFVNQTYTTVTPPNSSSMPPGAIPPSTNPVPHPFPGLPAPGELAKLTAQGILSKGQSAKSWALAHHVPIGSVFQSGTHVWSYARTGNSNAKPTAEAVLPAGWSVEQWANSVGVPVQSVKQGPNRHVYTYAPRTTGVAAS